MDNITEPWGVAPVHLRQRKNGAPVDLRGSFAGPPSDNRWLYQFTKKLYAARYFFYEQALIMDSDSIALQPFSFQGLFDNFFSDPFAFVKNASIVHHTSNKHQSTRDEATHQAKGAAGAPAAVEPYCNPVLRLWQRMGYSPTWTYHGWFVEKPIVEDFFLHVEAQHNTSFYHASVGVFGVRRCFEYPVYQQFVLASPKHRRRYRPVDVAASFKDHLPADIVQRYGLPKLEFTLTWLMEVVRGDSDRDRARSGLERWAQNMRIGFFRPPHTVDKGRPPKSAPASQRESYRSYVTAFYPVARLFLANCPTVVFHSCSAHLWDGGQVAGPNSNQSDQAASTLSILRS